jgi:uncharacterized membrane protein YsdA (DUF1294 family)
VDPNQQAKRTGIAVLFVALFLLVALWFVSMAIDKKMAARLSYRWYRGRLYLAG